MLGWHAFLSGRDDQLAVFARTERLQSSAHLIQRVHVLDRDTQLTGRRHGAKTLQFLDGRDRVDVGGVDVASGEIFHIGDTEKRRHPAARAHDDTDIGEGIALAAHIDQCRDPIGVETTDGLDDISAGVGDNMSGA